MPEPSEKEEVEASDQEVAEVSEEEEAAEAEEEAAEVDDEAAEEQEEVSEPEEEAAEASEPEEEAAEASEPEEEAAADEASEPEEEAAADEASEPEEEDDEEEEQSRVEEQPKASTSKKTPLPKAKKSEPVIYCLSRHYLFHYLTSNEHYLQFRSSKNTKDRILKDLKAGKILRESGLKKAKKEFDSRVDEVYRIAEYTSKDINRMTIDDKLTAILKNFSKF